MNETMQNGVATPAGAQREVRRSHAICALLAAAVAAFSVWGWFFGGAPFGINILVCLVAAYVCVVAGLRGRLQLRRASVWLLGAAAILLAASFAWISNSFLLFLNFVALLAVLGMQIPLMGAGYVSEPFTIGFLREICYTLFIRPFHKIGSFFGALFGSGKGGGSGALIGVAIAIPVLAVLVALLYSADAVFAGIVDSLFAFNGITDVFTWLLLTAVLAMFAGSFAVSLRRHTYTRTATPRTPMGDFHLGAVYVLTISVAVVLATFAVTQIVYMSMGSAALHGVTPAEYARSGFFQLCFAAVLVFTLTALCFFKTRRASAHHRLILSCIYTVLFLSILMLLISSFTRLSAYEQVFEFTRLRLYVQAFILMLGVVTAFCLLRVWSPRLPLSRLICGTVCLSLICLSFFNVDGFIAARNTADWGNISSQQRREELNYLLTLSEDAVPWYIDKCTEADFSGSSEDTPYSTYTTRAYRLMCKYRSASSKSLFSYNVNRKAALAAFERNRPLLEAAAKTADSASLF